MPLDVTFSWLYLTSDTIASLIFLPKNSCGWFTFHPNGKCLFQILQGSGLCSHDLSWFKVTVVKSCQLEPSFESSDPDLSFGASFLLNGIFFYIAREVTLRFEIEKRNATACLQPQMDLTLIVERLNTPLTYY